MGGFTDLFVKRPVLASVVSLVILMLGLRAIQSLNVREYPETYSSVITISTPYFGADAELVRGFITTPLEQAIATAEGIDYLESTSVQGTSTIRARLLLNYDPNAAVAQIITKINQVRNRLPPGSEDPIVTVTPGEPTAAMYIAFYSEVLERNQVTDYLNRAVRPRLETLIGVQEAPVLGGQTVAMRIWLDPKRMAAFRVTSTDVRAALEANNFIAAVGATKGATLSISLDAATNLHSVEEFERLVVREDNGALIRLRDVADVSLGAESYNTSVYFDGVPGVFIAVEAAPTANTLDVAASVRDVFPDIQRQLPAGIRGVIVYDSTDFIRDSMREVLVSLAEALAIVTGVIYLFLGSARAALVPAVAMPLSLVGSLFLILVMGFTINLLTLLALILAIGMVVDDGTVIVENVHRHMEEGKSRFEAALESGRELAAPIVAMNIVVVAVYAPIGFMTGLTGNLFTEFAFTVVGATLISGVVGLTLSFMLCSKLLRRETEKRGLSRRVDAGFGWVDEHYGRLLHTILEQRWLVLLFGGVVLIACYFLYIAAEDELAPTEDQGFLIVQATADPNVSIDHLERWTRQVGEIIENFDATDHSFIINGVAPGGGGVGSAYQAFAGMSMRDWEEREQTQFDIMPELQDRVDRVAGLQSAVFPPPALPGAGGGTPVQWVIGTTEETEALYDAVQRVLERALQSGKFDFIETDLHYDRLQVQVEIDRAKAADLGIDMQQLGGDLATLLSEGYINYFSVRDRSYRVIPQVERVYRLRPEQLENYYLRARNGALIPASTVIRLTQTVQPRELARFNQLNAATLSGVPAPGVTLGEAVDFLRTTVAETLPGGYVTDWKGQSRQYVQESAELVTAFFLAVILIYLVLAAQFESFRDPAIMLVSVPMSLAGALLFMALGVVTVNIYTQVGLLTLIGSIIRHGILLVEFANEVQRREGLDRRRAMETAAAIRLRPILMTTIATLVGMIPLWFASGPGAESRFAIGFVLGAGMAIGTLFTLFVVPGFYTVIASERAGSEKREQGQET